MVRLRPSINSGLVLSEVEGRLPLTLSLVEVLIMLRRIHVFYSGRVQGVGFRFITEDLARKLGVSGWVKNLPDSRVELIAEAGESALKDFLVRIKQYFRSYIQDIDIQWQDPTGEFSDFGINF